MWSTVVITGKHARGLAKNASVEVLYFYYGDVEETEMNSFLEEYHKNTYTGVSVIPIRLTYDGELVECLHQESERLDYMMKAHALNKEMSQRFGMLSEYMHDNADEIEAMLLDEFSSGEENEWEKLANRLLAKSMAKAN